MSQIHFSSKSSQDPSPLQDSPWWPWLTTHLNLNVLSSLSAPNFYFCQLRPQSERLLLTFRRPRRKISNACAPSQAKCSNDDTQHALQKCRVRCCDVIQQPLSEHRDFSVEQWCHYWNSLGLAVAVSLSKILTETGEYAGYLLILRT